MRRLSISHARERKAKEKYLTIFYICLFCVSVFACACTQVTRVCVAVRKQFEEVPSPAISRSWGSSSVYKS